LGAGIRVSGVKKSGALGKMILQRLSPLFLVLMIGLPAQSQVQLFEQDISGLVPHVVYKWNAGIQEYSLGLEYNIDGRTSLGFDFTKPVKDTFDFDPELKAYTVNPYAIFEFIEPGNLSNFSFAIRGDFIHENSNKKNPTPQDADKLNTFRRSSIGGGPIFALRIFSSDKLAMVPSVGYEFFYVSYHRDRLDGLAGGDFDEGYYLWHDAVGGCAFHYIISEFNGLTLEPRISLKIGEGRAAEDLVNVSASLGYVRSF
jgi:hypothetical protein